jgi:hypothetical protein
MVHVALLGVSVVMGSSALRRSADVHESSLHFDTREDLVSVGGIGAPPLLDDVAVLLPAPKELIGPRVVHDRCRRRGEQVRDAGVVATGSVQFVVDTFGLPDEHSWQIKCAADPALERHMFDAAMQLRFIPARVEGRRVRRVVVQHFAVVRSEIRRLGF